jgi:hypothetical protein
MDSDVLWELANPCSATAPATATKVIQPFERIFYFSPDFGLLGFG